MTDSAPQELIKPGIYFGMHEATYHADPALGSTSLKAIAVDPYEFQFDKLYGEEKDTEAMIFGSALHARLLEGVDSLNAKFCKAFDKSTCEGALDTIDDLKKALGELGQTKLSGMKKADLVMLLRTLDPSARIVDVIRAEFDSLNAGKVQLPPRRWAQIDVAARWVQRDPLLSAVMENGTFKDGAPEVSVFYEDRGVRLKARFDRLLRHAIIDVKSFMPMFPGRLESTAIRTIDRMKYNFQAAAYLRAWHKAKELFAAGLVFGDEPVADFLKDAFDRTEPRWIWIMVKSKGAPQPLVIDWKATMARSADAARIEAAIDDYIRLRAEFGEDAEWPPMRPAMTVEDQDLPTYFGT